MGLSLNSPVVVASCSLSGRIDNIKRAEAAGAGAMVIRSLFEEQIMAEGVRLDEQVSVGADSFPESLSYFPPLEHAGPREHLMWVAKTCRAVKMPVIGSLNAVTPGAWVAYARRMQEAGVAALELNVYAVQTDVGRSGRQVEAELYETVENVLAAVTVPVAVKLSPYYTSVVNVAKKLDERGVGALVLFNRFLQPDIDVEAQTLRNEMEMSLPCEMRPMLRHIALLHGKLRADLAGAGGVQDGRDVVKALLAGAAVVQVAGALYTHQMEHAATMNEQIDVWMAGKGYGALADFRGKLSQEDMPDRFAFERAQYVELLLQQV